MCISISFLKFWPISHEEETCVVSCVHQHHCIIFDFFLWWERMSIVLLFSSIYDQTLCFLIGRERLSISFHCCRVCFQILFEETFSMLYNLSGCLSAENPCNLHEIIAIFFIFLHEYHVFILRPSSLIHIVVLKTSWRNISWSKESRYRKRIAMTSDCYAQRSMEYLTGKEWKKEAGEYKQWTLENIH